MKIKELFSAKFANNQANQIQIVDSEEKLPSLNIAFELAKENLDYQLTQADALDNKANSLQIAAPGLVGVDLILLAVLLPLPRSSLVHMLQDILLIPLLLTCALAILCANNSYRISSYIKVPKPSGLRKYLKEPEDYTKEVLFETFIDAFALNECEINKKIDKLKIARIMFSIELIMFTLVLITQVILFQFMK